MIFQCRTCVENASLKIDVNTDINLVVAYVTNILENERDFYCDLRTQYVSREKFYNKIRNGRSLLS